LSKVKPAIQIISEIDQPTAYICIDATVNVIIHGPLQALQ